MKILKKIRSQRGLSQRVLARRARLSFRTIQLLESGKHDPRISSLEKWAKAMNYPTGAVTAAIQRVFNVNQESIRTLSRQWVSQGEDSWKILLFDFVDTFRKNPGFSCVELPPVVELRLPATALLASVVDTLCEETKIMIPLWCRGVSALEKPWFVSGMENLKASALLESPVHFRKRNIFVLDNFLDRV